MWKSYVTEKKTNLPFSIVLYLAITDIFKSSIQKHIFKHALPCPSEPSRYSTVNRSKKSTNHKLPGINFHLH